MLVEKISNDSDETLEITGQALGSNEGHIFRSRKIQCSQKVSISSSLLSVNDITQTPSQIAWSCESDPHSWILKKPIQIKDRSDFVQYKKAWYRGTLEIYPTADALYLINHVPIDDYIASLIHGEMPETYNIEALKAQAVAARSYAVAQALKRRNYGLAWDVKDSDRDQMYPGAQRETRASLQAALSTKDEYLISDDQILKAYYSAASGGHSELPSYVWGRKDEDKHYVAKPNPWDKGRYQWNIDLSSGISALWQKLGKLIDIQVTHRTAGSRVENIKLIGSIREIDLSPRAFAKRLGMGSFKSLKFDITKNENGFKFEGEGWGHGVGLSQVAAQKMALAGNGYKKILAFHYPKTSIENLQRNKVLEDKSLRIPAHAR
ncbi:SpoIID/LytB domain-containing protein [bacterium]|nr:SpoIID/LytB domain-containing protein [bacterium]